MVRPCTTVLMAGLMAILMAISILAARPAAARTDTALEITAEGSYLAPEGTSREDALAFSDFEARLSAVRQAVGPLAREGHVAFASSRREEILALAADDVHTDYLERACHDEDDAMRCVTMVRCQVTPDDFSRAEANNYRLERKEDLSDLQREMEPTFTGPPEPARYLSRAYRELSRGRLRPAYIYLDRLLEAHPHWTSALRALARTNVLLGDEEQAESLYTRACDLGDALSCKAVSGE